MTGKKKTDGTPKPFMTDDREAAFHHFQPIVSEIPKTDLERWNYSAELIRHNVGRAVDAIRPHLEELATKLVHVQMDQIAELPTLASALAFADSRVVAQASPKEIKA